MLTSLRNSLANLLKPPRPPKRQNDKNGRFRVSALRSGSCVQRSDSLQIGDTVTSINGSKTCKLNPDEVTHLLRSSERIQLDVEYDIPSAHSPAGSSISPRQILCRTAEIELKKLNSEAGGFGFTVRPGSVPSEHFRNRPLIVTHIRNNSPAEREGSIHIGDRILSINGHDVRNASLAQAQKLLREANNKVTLVIEYDVSVVDTCRYSQSHLLVEVERPQGSILGINLRSADNNRILIDSIAPASIAERCGALHAGDQIVAIGDIRLDGGDMGPYEAMQLLRNYAGDVVKLIIVSSGGHRRMSEQSARRDLLPPPSPRPSHCSTLNSARNRNNSARSKQGRPLQRVDSCASSSRLETVSVASGSTQGSLGTPSAILLGHPELVSVTLQIDCRGSYGLNLGQSQECETPIVLSVETNSPADRSGCIQSRDRILRINQQSTAGMRLDEVVSLIRESRPRIVLDVEFDVADSVVPASGIFWVKLVRRGSTLGITLVASGKGKTNEYFIISQVLPGSVAYRTGSVQSGDKLLAIDNSKAESMTLEEANQLLQSSGEDVVRLKLQKGETEEIGNVPVVYTVELVRHGGPLGITISGTESPTDPIVISGLTEGGLAEKTGAVHVGDKLLAINGRSLQGKLLSEAIEILQNSGDIVTLKIAKASRPVQASVELGRDDYLSIKYPALPSIDSAVESWVSGNSGPSPNDSSPPLYTAESATVRRRQKAQVHSRDWDVDSGQFEGNFRPDDPSSSAAVPSCATSDPGDSAEPIRFSDLALVQRCTTLPRNYQKLMRKDSEVAQTSFTLSSPMQMMIPPNMEVHQVSLQKDSVYEDFGFSVSDGLYERGVYVNRVRKGGPADVTANLKPYDRILQVNDTRTVDFDCCLTVPLIAAAGDSITMVIGRNTDSTPLDLKENGHLMNWTEEEEPIPADAEDLATSSLFSGVRTVTTTL